MSVITTMASEPWGLQAMTVAARLGNCPGLVESMIEKLCCSHEVIVTQPHPSLTVFLMPSAMANKRWHPKPKLLAQRWQCRWSWDCYCGKNISSLFLVCLCMTCNSFWSSGGYVSVLSSMLDALERGNEEKSAKWMLPLWGMTIDKSEGLYRCVHEWTKWE